jgi:hypothetical protein
MSELDFAEELKRGARDMKKFMADVGGANSPEMKAAARALARGIRKELAKHGTRKDRSKPGESPRRQLGKLVKSIGIETVGGVIRVGSGRFTSRILQDGTTHATRGAATDKAGNRRHKRQTLKRSSVTIAPRPFMEKGLARALPTMDGEFIAELEKRKRST